MQVSRQFFQQSQNMCFHMYKWYLQVVFLLFMVFLLAMHLKLDVYVVDICFFVQELFVIPSWHGLSRLHSGLSFSEGESFQCLWVYPSELFFLYFKVDT